jgi:hypothetical protein
MVFRPIRKFKKVQKAVEVENVSIFQPPRFGISCLNKISKPLNSNFKMCRRQLKNVKIEMPSYSTAFCTLKNFLIGLQAVKIKLQKVQKAVERIHIVSSRLKVKDESKSKW